MNIALWIVQGVLAAMFGLAGIIKTTSPLEKLGKQMAWTTRFSPTVVRLVGLSEFLGAFGLILPMLLGILPILTPVTAAGLALIMLLAAIHHAQNNEAKMIPMNLVMGGLALFVAYGRF